MAKHTLRRNVFVATESTFGVEAIGSASYQQVECEEFSAASETAQIDPEFQREDLARDPNEVGRQAPTVELTIPARGSNTPAGVDTQASLNAEIGPWLLACASIVPSVGLAIDGAGTTTSLTYTDSGNEALLGGIYGITALSGGSDVEFVQFDAVNTTTDAVEWAYAISDVPESGGIVYAATNITPAVDGMSSLSVFTHTDIRNNKVIQDIITGCMGSFTLGGAVGEDMGSFFSFKFSFLGDGHRHDKTSATPDYTVADGAGAIESKSNILQTRGCSLKVDNESIPFSSVEFDDGQTQSECTDGSNDNGRGAYVSTEQIPTIKFTMPQDTAVTFDPHLLYSTTGGEFHVHLQVSDDESNNLVIVAPVCQILEISESDINGILAWEVTCKICRSDVSGVSPWTIGIFGAQ